MSQLTRLPLFGIIISFILGLIIAHKLEFSLQFGVGLLCIGAFLTLLSYLFLKNYKKFRIIFGLIVVGFGFISGIAIHNIHNDSLYPNHYTKYISQNKQLISLIINQQIKPTKHHYRYFAFVESIDSVSCFGKILVYCPRSQFEHEPQIGQRITAFTTLDSNQKGLNPNAFDYDKYLKQQQVYAKIQLDSINHKYNDLEQSTAYFFENIRNKIIQNINKHDFNATELAIFKALLLGQRQDVDTETLRNYQYSGAIHILAVSGLHVAYLFGFLIIALRFLPNNQTGKFVKFVVLSSFLLLFVLITGTNPPTIRASLMCVILYLGFLLNRNPNNMYNILFSAWLILLFEPGFIGNIGFQLSYFAVFFIVWAVPILNKIYKPKSVFFKYIWNICILSVVAQLGVLPLSLYYFGLFPTLFIITNLLVLPLLSILMIYGIILSVLAYFDLIFYPTTQILEFLILLINKTIKYIAHYEGFILNNIPFNLLTLFCSYLVIFLIFKTFENFKNNIQKLLISLIILQLSFYYSYLSNNNSEQMIVFNASRKSLFAVHWHDNLTYYTNDSVDVYVQNIITDYNKQSFQNTYSISKSTNLFFINNQKILVIDHNIEYSSDLQADIIILKDSPKINLDRWLTNHKPKIVIADGSNYPSFVNLWHKSCDIRQVNFHHTFKDGFYQID